MKKTCYTVLGMSILLIAGLAFAFPVPDTGQVKCYGAGGGEIPCPSPGDPLYGQDANYSIKPMSFTKLDINGNELSDTAKTWSMVKDNVTGLIWEVKNNKDRDPDYSNPHDADNEYTWYDSNPATNGGDPGTPSSPLAKFDTDTEDFISLLNEEKFGGFKDWRLPTQHELMFLVDDGVKDPTIKTKYFPDTIGSYYWSSSTNHEDPSMAWSTFFENGWGLPLGKSGKNYARAVRGERFTNSFVDNGDGTVKDDSTGLTWQKETPDTLYNWGTAMSYCENLNLGGHTDWRLPTKKELLSLNDFGKTDPSINKTYFPDTPSLASTDFHPNYWTSTTYSSLPGDAWVIHFVGGRCQAESKYESEGTLHYVRAVRGVKRPYLQAGVSSGIIAQIFSANEIVELIINSTNPREDTPSYEWLLFTGIIGGQQYPVYLLSDIGIFDLNQVISNPYPYIRKFDSSGLTPIAELSMASLGLQPGDTFIYGYAYQNQLGAIFMDNIVFITVK